MRTIQCSTITSKVKKILLDANYSIGSDLLYTLQTAAETELFPSGKEILEQIIQNDTLATENRLPICQDTGLVVVFVEYGQELIIEGGSFEEAIQEAVRQAYSEGYLRKSVVSDPLFDRINTGDNTPAVIHTRIVPGDTLRIDVTPKGFGSENMSAVAMMPPAKGIQGAKDFILQTVENAGPNACPPFVVGIGIGSSFEGVTLLAKRALLRGTNRPHCDPRYRELECDLLNEINQLGIGPAGLGGSVTALTVNIEEAPTHIASLPVAVNICCHAARHAVIHI